MATEGMGELATDGKGELATDSKGELTVVGTGDDDGDGTFGGSTLVGVGDGAFGIENEIKSAKIETDPEAAPHRRFMAFAD
mmetsp:Transcript_97545/g.146185  ORF Transcript_97545/g.146185 Transcript_97545/m.146185 type:complete len:81 (-) Transcript_97545:800-1042(-)